MLITIPDHYRDTLASAMVNQALLVIQERDSVPTFLHQYADMWSRGINYGNAQTFWEVVSDLLDDEDKPLVSSLV